MPLLLRHAGAMLAGLVALPGIAAAAERCAVPAGRIVAVEELVEVSLGAGWAPLRLGEPVCGGDVLRAGDGGRSALTLESGAILRLAPGTTIRIENVVAGERTLLELIGGVASFFSRRPHALEVDTQFGNAAVEGTEFTVEALPDRARVTVLEGRVRFSNALGQVRLEPGEAAVAVAGRAPEIELRIRPRDAVQWALYYPPLPAARLTGGAQAAARLAGEGRRGEALRLLEGSPRDAGSEALRAELLLGLGRVGEAEAALAEALRREPGNADALALRAVIAVARNDKEQALADARRAAALAPANPRPHLALSYAAQAAFDIPLARRSLEAAAAAAPDDPLVAARLAEVRLMEGDTGGARAAAERAQELGPENARAQTVAGFVALARVETEAARAAFARAVERDPFNPLARLGQGLARIRDGDLAGGREEIELAVALDPADALLRSYLGKAYLEERRFRLAGEELGRAKELDANDPTPWFYDAIRKQRENRPVEALRDLEEAIARNDNRAVYRSRLLLDQDRANRGATLARIFSDLGFERRGELVAFQSLNADPTSYAARRFLADTFAVRPRHELARDSELLVSRLLQPLETEPIDPKRAAEIDAFGSRTLAREVGLDSDRLFERDGARLNANAGVGSDRTLTEDVTAALVEGRNHLSLGQFHYETDGIRSNNNQKRDAYELFGQRMLSPSTSVLVDVRRRKIDEQDSFLLFDPDAFFPDAEEVFWVNEYRAGARYEPRPDTALIGTLAAQWLSDDYDDSEEDFEGRQYLYQGELRALAMNRLGPFTVGGSFGTGDQKVTSVFFDGTREELNDTLRQGSLFAEQRLERGRIGVELGLSVETYADDATDRTQLSPRLGLDLALAEDLTFRAAASRRLQRTVIGGQTIEPITLAGFNQLYEDFNGADTWRYTVGLDGRLRPLRSYWNLQAQYSQHDLFNVSAADDQQDQDELELSGAFSTVLSDRLTSTIGYEYQHLSSTTFDNLQVAEKMRLHLLPVELRYFHPNGLTLRLRATPFWQDGEFLDAEGEPFSADEADLVLDAGASYEFEPQRAAVGVELRNLLDADFRFEDVDPRFSRLKPGRQVLFLLSLAF